MLAVQPRPSKSPARYELTGLFDPAEVQRGPPRLLTTCSAQLPSKDHAAPEERPRHRDVVGLVDVDRALPGHRVIPVAGPVERLLAEQVVGPGDPRRPGGAV